MTIILNSREGSASVLLTLVLNFPPRCLLMNYHYLWSSDQNWLLKKERKSPINASQNKKELGERKFQNVENLGWAVQAVSNSIPKEEYCRVFENESWQKR